MTGAIGAGASATFAVFARPTGDIAFEPGTLRVFVPWTDSRGGVAGRESFAGQTGQGVRRFGW